MTRSSTSAPWSSGVAVAGVMVGAVMRSAWPRPVSGVSGAAGRHL